MRIREKSDVLQIKMRFKKMTANELHKTFLIENLFVRNEKPIIYSEIDRSIIDLAVSSKKVLKLTS